MAKEEFTPKQQRAPDGGWNYNAMDIREYSLTRREAVDLIANLAAALSLPGGHSISFTVDDRGVSTCRVCFDLIPAENDPSLRY
jgi:hypothetical protein